MQLGVFRTLFWQVCTIYMVQCLTYYIKPSENITCPINAANCATIAVFSAGFKHMRFEIISLIFLYGNYYLDSNLSFSGVRYVSMASEINTMEARATVACHKSVQLTFTLVSQVQITNIDLVDCIESKITEVENFVIEGVMLERKLMARGSAMIVKSSKLHLSKSSVINFYGSLWKIQVASTFNQASAGGVMILSNSSVRVFNCTFKNNSAEVGAAVFAQNGSSINFQSSGFMDHFCMKRCFGGLMFLKQSNVFISHCTFLRNAFNPIQSQQLLVSKGGIIQCFESDVAVDFGHFYSNYASMGAVVESKHCTISFYKCNFVQNTAKLNGGIGLFKTSTVHVNSSNFTRNHATEKAGGAFYAERSTVYFDKSSFNENQAYNLGGVARLSKSNVTIRNCNFSNNTAISEFGKGGVFYFTQKTFARLINTIYFGNKAYAGGAIISNSGGELQLRYNSIFTKNSAHYGGTIQIHYSSFSCNCTLTISSNAASWGVLIFLHGSGRFYGKLTYKRNTGSLLAFDSEISVTGNIHFRNNTPERTLANYAGVNEGGGITSILSTVTLQGKITLSQNKAINGGGILAISSRIIVNSGRLLATGNNATDTGGGAYAYHSEILIVRSSACVSYNRGLHKGGGIHLVSSSLVLVARSREPSNIIFNNNFAKTGGGVCLEESSKLYMTTNSVVIKFTDNRAEYGGAVYVSDDTNNGTCTSSEYTRTSTSDSDCFFQSIQYNAYNNSKVSYITNHIFFSGNTAKSSGAILYGGLLDRCTVNVFDRNAYIKILYSTQPNFTDGVLNDTSSDAVRVCFCKSREAEVDCDYQPGTIHVIKGENFTLNIVAVDHVNHTLSHTIIHSYLSHKDSRLGKGQKAQITNSPKCTMLTFSVYTLLETEIMILYPEGPCKDANRSRRLVSIQFLPCVCPVGFEPSIVNSYTCKCDCHSSLQKFATSCDPSTALVHRKGDAWITIFNYSDKIEYFIHSHCPFDYCLPSTVDVGINLGKQSGSDAQCDFNRSGILCSVCKPGLSVSLGSSQCVFCPKYWPALLFIITVSALLAGLLIVWLVLTLNLTVAVGTLNGIIFYANIIAANKSVFLPFVKPNFHSVVISWLNLDVGFNTCFIKGMDVYTKTWIEFFFSIYLITLVVGVILICEYSRRFASILGKRNPVATLATLILFSYAKLLQSVITSLAFTFLKYPDGSHELVWRPDATVKYFSKKHVPLFLVGLVVLVISLLLQ